MSILEIKNELKKLNIECKVEVLDGIDYININGNNHYGYIKNFKNDLLYRDFKTNDVYNFETIDEMIDFFK